MNNHKIKNISVMTLLVVALGWAGSVAATTPFVYDSSGTAVRDGAGDCLLNGHGPRDGFNLITCQAIVAQVERAPAPVAAPAPEPMKTPEPLRKVTYSASALFDFDQAALRPEGRKALDQLVADINADVRVERISVVGHTCSIGAEDYNQGLSERRAATVKSYLVSKGISADKIDASGKGESSPIASNATREGRAQNRRVEVELIGMK